MPLGQRAKMGSDAVRRNDLCERARTAGERGLVSGRLRFGASGKCMQTLSAVVRGGMVLLGFWNAIRVDDVGWKREETVTSTWGRLRGAVAVASLVGMMGLCAQGGVARQTQSSSAATEQTKQPASKSKTTPSGKPGGSGTKPGSAKTKPAGSSKT